MHALMLELLHSAATDSDIERIIIIAEAVPMVITRSDIMLATDFLYLSYTAVPLSHWRHQPWGTRSAHPLEFVYVQFLDGVSKMSQVTRVISYGAHVPPTP